MEFTDKVEKLIQDAREKHDRLDAARKQMLDDRTVLDKRIRDTVEEELRVIGELRALEKVRAEATDQPAKES